MCNAVYELSLQKKNLYHYEHFQSISNIIESFARVKRKEVIPKKESESEQKIRARSGDKFLVLGDLESKSRSAMVISIAGECS